MAVDLTPRPAAPQCQPPAYYVTLQRDAEDPNRRWFQPGDVVDTNPDRALALAALSHDDQRLAACDPANSSRVDVWEADGRRTSGLQMENDAPIEWLGWSHGGKLLTLTAGALCKNA